MQPGRFSDGLGRDIIHYGHNSGYQAVNLAYLWGAGRIILLGYDMQPDSKGKSHFFGDHTGPLLSGHNYSGWIGAFNALARDLERERVDVINCTRNTALTCFRKMNLEDALALPEAGK